MKRKKKLVFPEGDESTEPTEVVFLEVGRDPEVPTLESAIENWEVKMGELFEWVGMACLSAQRSVLPIASLCHS